MGEHGYRRAACKAPMLKTVAAAADAGAGPGPAPSPPEGHSQVLSRLFEQHNRTLVSFLINRLGNEAEAREVAQEAYVRILQLDQPGAVSFLRAYLFRTASNIAMDRLRHRSRTEHHRHAHLHDDAANLLCPERETLASEALDLLRQALHELPPRYRQAFLRHRFDDWSSSEIGREIGVNERQARNYIQRAAAYCRMRVDGTPREDAMRCLLP